MLNTEFFAFTKARVDEGQQQLAQIIRLILYRTAPELFQLLDSDDDSIFLEPLLFAYFNASDSMVTLDQILFGYIQEDLRPTTITVFADADGIVSLPEIGYLATQIYSDYAQLHWCKSTPLPIVTFGERPITYDLQQCIHLKNTAIEISRYNHPLLRHYFRESGENMDVEVTATTFSHIDNLTRAAALIQRYYSVYFDLITAVTRRVFIYKGLHPYSFATLSAHGIAFLNATEALDEVFFIEDIIHQCGHIIFNVITNETTEYLSVDPEAPLSRFVPVDDESSIYASFHGLFTQANITHFLYTCYDRHIFSGRQEHELLGRFSDDMKRFASALALLDRRELYTDKGWILYSTFKQAFVELYHISHPIIHCFDTANQPYIFNYDIFQKTNPLNAYCRPAKSRSV